jgi:type IX secretion system substrate protein
VNNNPIFRPAHVLDNSPLVIQPFPCINGSGSSFPFGNNPPAFIHPLDNNSPSTSITTASFYNKKLSWALNFSLEKMTDLNDVPKINQAADLLTEVLKYNYPTPVTNYADKYLLELAYQKLFSCVAQLTQIYRPLTDSLGSVPANLQPRYGDLMQIIAFRLGRKSINDVDYKEVNDLILLDKAMVYSLQEDRPNAIATISGILAGNPKTEHRNLYEYWKCVFSNEQDAITHLVPVPDAMANIKKCSDNFKAALYSPSGARKSGDSGHQPHDVEFANEFAIAVYPNPATEDLNVDYDLKQFRNISLEIIDVQGKKLRSYLLSPAETSYHIRNIDLESGIYFYHITGDEKVLMNKKLVITK